MMRRVPLIALLLVAGCAPAWVEVGGLHRSEFANFSAELPQGWMRLSTDEALLITRDGVLLQAISIGRRQVDKPFTHTKKMLRIGMLPQEMAEVILDNIASDPGVLNFQIIENVPTKISGFEGFKAVFTYKNKDGLRFKSVSYGFMAGEWFHGLRYSAAARHYFDKDLKTFERVLESFRLVRIT